MVWFDYYVKQLGRGVINLFLGLNELLNMFVEVGVEVFVGVDFICDGSGNVEFLFDQVVDLIVCIWLDVGFEMYVKVGKQQNFMVFVFLSF